MQYDTIRYDIHYCPHVLSATYIIILYILQEKNEYNKKKPKHSTLPIFLIASIQMKHNIMKKG